ncbi:hypothetical protein WJX74_010149 [Apatococcus lobatus]|uniref:Uncharacterized protein n=1 Tax=Apatococcus lobatus TaxID=904363 RepID=A0AAW1RM61_9CHLO
MGLPLGLSVIYHGPMTAPDAAYMTTMMSQDAYELSNVLIMVIVTLAARRQQEAGMISDDPRARRNADLYILRVCSCRSRTRSRPLAAVPEPSQYTCTAELDLEAQRVDALDQRLANVDLPRSEIVAAGKRIACIARAAIATVLALQSPPAPNADHSLEGTAAAPAQRSMSSYSRTAISATGACELQEMPVSIAEVSYGSELSAQEKTEAKGLVSTFADVWAWKDDEVNTTSEIAHHIDTGNQEPIKQRPYRLSKHEEEIVDAEVQKWLQQDIVEPSQSPWASPVVLVPKKKINPDDPTDGQ